MDRLPEQGAQHSLLARIKEDGKERRRGSCGILWSRLGGSGGPPTGARGPPPRSASTKGATRPLLSPTFASTTPGPSPCTSCTRLCVCSPAPPAATERSPHLPAMAARNSVAVALLLMALLVSARWAHKQLFAAPTTTSGAGRAGPDLTRLCGG